MIFLRFLMVSYDKGVGLMKKRRAGVFWISTAGLAVILFLGLTVLQAEVVNVHADVIDGKILLQATEEPPAVDHSQFPQLSQEFGSGSDVTKACLKLSSGECKGSDGHLSLDLGIYGSFKWRAAGKKEYY